MGKAKKGRKLEIHAPASGVEKRSRTVGAKDDRPPRLVPFIVRSQPHPYPHVLMYGMNKGSGKRRTDMFILTRFYV